MQYAADVRLHRNVPGRAALRGDSYPLEMPQGISVFEEGDAPRLPLIGLRTIVANKLRLVIDGDRRQVTLKTKGWPWQRGKRGRAAWRPCFSTAPPVRWSGRPDRLEHRRTENRGHTTVVDIRYVPIFAFILALAVGRREGVMEAVVVGGQDRADFICFRLLLHSVSACSLHSLRLIPLGKLRTVNAS